MFRTLTLALPVALLSLASTTGSWAQCPGCVPDVSCTVSPAFPALCPQQLPEATAGEYYETDVTFWLPASFEEPGSGLTVTFEQMTITSITGLPFGLGIETSEPSGVYDPQVSEFGCARICGTPLGAGTYTVTINIVASVSVGGFPVNAPQQFAIDLVVLPGSGTNNGFSFTPTSGCGSVEVSFQALIDGAPQPTAWTWDFGNGNSSTLATPPPQTYDEPGTYEVTLQTTISSFVLQQVVLSGVNGNWCGDVEEPNIPLIGCVGAPDLYFVLTDAGGNSYTSGTVDDVTNATWNNLGLVLSNPPYSISFWDEDVISPNDHLGTYNIPLSNPGTYPFNVAGGTTGSLSINLQVTQQFTDTDVITVFPMPDVVLVEDPETGELCATDTELVGYLWLLDGDTVPGATGPCFTPDAPGLWQVVGTNGFGCTATSDPVVVCPVITITYANGVLSVPSGFQGYAWTFNGTPIPGANGSFVFSQGDGTYAVTVTAPNDCVVTAEYALSTIGIGELPSGTAHMTVFPVPNTGEFTVAAEGLSGLHVWLRLTDMTGRVVHERQEKVTNGRLLTVVLVDVRPGPYLVQLQDGAEQLVLRVVIH